MYKTVGLISPSRGRAVHYYETTIDEYQTLQWTHVRSARVQIDPRSGQAKQDAFVQRFGAGNEASAISETTTTQSLGLTPRPVTKESLTPFVGSPESCVFLQPPGTVAWLPGDPKI